MEYNIHEISKARDLSPRHKSILQNIAKKGRPVIPLQVKIKRSRDKLSSSDK